MRQADARQVPTVEREIGRRRVRKREMARVWKKAGDWKQPRVSREF